MLSGICRAFFARCLACADDANRFFVILHSSGINNKDDPADRGETNSYGSKLRLRVFNVIVVQPIGIGEDSSRLLKRDSVLLEVSEGFARIPREHITVYTLITAFRSTCTCSTIPKLRRRHNRRVAGSFSLPAVVARGETGQFTGDNGLVCLRGLGGLQRAPSSEKLTANTATAGSSVNGAGGSSDHGPDTAGFSNSQRFPARHKCALALGKREFRG